MLYLLLSQIILLQFHTFSIKNQIYPQVIEILIFNSQHLKSFSHLKGDQGQLIQFTQSRETRGEILFMLTSKHICTFEKAVTAHIWDFGILADKNKFPEAMQRDEHLRETARIVTRNIISKLDVSEWKGFNNRQQRTNIQSGFITMHRCAHTYMQILRRTHPVHTVHVFVSFLSVVYFFPLILCLSVCQAICVYFPSMATCLLPPPMLFTEMTPVWKFFTVFCAFLSLLDFFFFDGGCFKLKRDINVRVNGSWFNKKIRTTALVRTGHVYGSGTVKGLILLSVTFESTVLTSVGGQTESWEMGDTSKRQQCTWEKIKCL